jgi:hypothetical protein
MSYTEAHEAALESLIPKDGPEFSDDPPKALSAEDQEKVIRRLEQREEFRDKLRDRQKKQPEPD